MKLLTREGSQLRGFVPGPLYVLCESMRQICLAFAVTFGPRPSNKVSQAHRPTNGGLKLELVPHPREKPSMAGKAWGGP